MTQPEKTTVDPGLVERLGALHVWDDHACVDLAAPRARWLGECTCGQIRYAIEVLLDEIGGEPTGRYERARSGLMNRGVPLWRHSCGNTEAFTDAQLAEMAGGCDACESGSPNPADWRPLYVPADKADVAPVAGAETAYAWRVQWYSCADYGLPWREQGRRDFPAERDARAYLASDEVYDSLIPGLWRVELQRREIVDWETVAYRGDAPDVALEAEGGGPDA